MRSAVCATVHLGRMTLNYREDFPDQARGERGWLWLWGRRTDVRLRWWGGTDLVAFRLHNEGTPYEYSRDVGSIHDETVFYLDPYV